jgi:hypothetical protein
MQQPFSAVHLGFLQLSEPLGMSVFFPGSMVSSWLAYSRSLRIGVIIL